MKYKIVLADPPWQYGNRGTRACPSYAGEQRNEAVYETMDLDAVKRLGQDVKASTEETSILFLWAPPAMILDGTAQAVAASWGYVPKTMVPWVKATQDYAKPRIGLGNYVRNCSEHLIVCARGRATQLIADKGVAGVLGLDNLVADIVGVAPTDVSLESDWLPAPVVIAPPARSKHSSKPELAYKLIERLCAGHGPYLEMFARTKHSSLWHTWGNQAPEPVVLGATA